MRYLGLGLCVLTLSCANAIRSFGEGGDGSGGSGGSGGTITTSTSSGSMTSSASVGGASASSSGAGGSGNCPPGKTDCNGVCIDLNVDLSHCGACNNPCMFGEQCCTGECADLQSNSSHCGACGNECNGQCLAGTCMLGCCGYNQNDLPPEGNCFQGAQWIAWEVTPTCNFNLTRIELHSDMGNVALLADANNFPGALIFQGALGPPDPNGWIGADVSPAIPLTGGQKYWIAENVGLCSTANGGTSPTYYGSFGGLGGPWEGPYSSHKWTAHLVGQCAPPP